MPPYIWVSIKTIELYESGVLATSPFGAILRGSSLAVARRPGLVAVVVRIYRRLAHFAGRGRPALHRQLPGRLISQEKRAGQFVNNHSINVVGAAVK
jgi:hypothetical protein